jgi:hypothetical protein
VDQLTAVWVAYESFDTTYQLTGNAYWSSTERIYYYSWWVDFRTSYYSNTGYKDLNISVRCVREL